MSGAAFLRLKKLKGRGIIAKAARHNRRAIQAEVGASGSIDPARSSLNETLRGPAGADDVARLAADLMRRAGIVKVRRDGVLGVEVLFSLPVAHQLDDRAYFLDCVAWAAGRFGGDDNIISADLHRDESAPHCHVLVVPIIAGRMAGSDLVGNRRRLRDLQQEFHQSVGSRYGLAKAPARLESRAKAMGASEVLGSLRAAADSALGSIVWPQLREAIEANPGPFMLALNISVQRKAKKLRTMAPIFTSPGKGKKRDDNPIGFASPPRSRSLCPVGIASQPASLDNDNSRTPTKASKPTFTTPRPGPVETVRIYDCDLDPACFDAETGEFRTVGHANGKRRQKQGDRQAISYSVGLDDDG